MVGIHPVLHKWVVENIRIGHDLNLLRQKLQQSGHDPSIVDHIAAELKEAEKEDKFPAYIINYLKFASGKGHTHEKIRQNLRSNGFNDDDIDYLIKKHAAKPEKKEPVKKKKDVMPLIIILAIIIIAAVVIFGIRPNIGPGTTTTAAGATTTTLPGQGAETPLLNIDVTRSYFYNLLLENVSDGVKIDGRGFVVYQTDLEPGTYKFELVARADIGTNSEFYLPKDYFANRSLNNLLIKIEEHTYSDKYVLDLEKHGFYHGWPTIAIATDNEVLGMFSVNSSTWKSFSFEAEITSQNIWVFKFEGFPVLKINKTTVSDRNLYLNRINVYSG